MKKVAKVPPVHANKFISWYDKNSGYTLHLERPIRLPDCCRDKLVRSRDYLLRYDPRYRANIACDLYRCPACGLQYYKQGDEYYRVDNLLRYATGSQRLGLDDDE